MTEASGLDRSTGRMEAETLFRCCCVLHDGLGTTGVSPVPPSINDSKLKPGMPDEGVVIAIPAISAQVEDARGGAAAVVKGEATDSVVGLCLGAIVGLVNDSIRCCCW